MQHFSSTASIRHFPIDFQNNPVENRMALAVPPCESRSGMLRNIWRRISLPPVKTYNARPSGDAVPAKAERKESNSKSIKEPKGDFQ
jgi:hypothetical protein